MRPLDYRDSAAAAVATMNVSTTATVGAPESEGGGATAVAVEAAAVAAVAVTAGGHVAAGTYQRSEPRATSTSPWTGPLTAGGRDAPMRGMALQRFGGARYSGRAKTARCATSTDESLFKSHRNGPTRAPGRRDARFDSSGLRSELPERANKREQSANTENVIEPKR